MDAVTDADPGPPRDTTDDGNALRAAGVAVALTIAAFAVSLLGGVASLVPVLLLNLDIESVPVFLVLTAVGQVCFLLVGYVYARRRALTVRIEVPTLREVGYALGGILAAFVVATALSVLLAVLGMLPDAIIEDVIAIDRTVLLGLAAMSILLVAPAEEFLFRGVIQGRLRQSVGPIWAVAGASLCFGSLHLSNYSGATAAVAGGALLIAATGSVFGVLYERTENLTVPIVAHAGYNVVLMTLSYIAI